MEAKAIEKYIRISPRKVKYVIDIVKKKPVEEAIGILSLTPNRAAVYVKKAIQSASANATENFKEYKVAEDDLVIKEIYVNEGPTLKRFKPRARGRADRVLKRTSHITVLVSDENKKNLVKKGKKSNVKNKQSKKEAKV
ncbi:MAG: 50S ribosomal protein L22 [Actinobacteria bacterium ADurb.Bin346]|nr:MAG: 50S ribosomal protein L22 [Actinobacteria bacterium ADurb.Bin346]